VKKSRVRVASSLDSGSELWLEVLLKVFFFTSLKDWTAPEVGGVVPGAKCTLGWTISVLGALVSMMFCTTLNATGDLVVIVLAKIMAFMAFWKVMCFLSS